jgi:hypothetical protein
MRVVVHDYAGHPFQVELSRALAARGQDVFHLYRARSPQRAGGGKDGKAAAAERESRRDNVARSLPWAQSRTLPATRVLLELLARRGRCRHGTFRTALAPALRLVPPPPARVAAQLLFATSLWFVVIAARNDPVDTLVFAAFLVGPVLAIVTVASEGFLAARLRSKQRRAGTT